MVALSQHSKTMSDALERSAFEATEHHHEFQEPGHLFLALISRPGDNPAGRVLQAYGLWYEFVLPIVLTTYTPYVGNRTVEKFSQASVDIINAAEEIAQRDGDRLAQTRPHHLLIALINSNDAVVDSIFAAHGVDPKLILRRLDYEVADTDHLN